MSGITLDRQHGLLTLDGIVSLCSALLSECLNVTPTYGLGWTGLKHGNRRNVCCQFGFEKQFSGLVLNSHNTTGLIMAVYTIYIIYIDIRLHHLRFGIFLV